MPLTITTFPPQQCFIGGITQPPNLIPFVATSNLFPVNTADTARTILATGTTAGGFFWIEVSNSFAAQFPQGSSVSVLGREARVLVASTITNWRMVLNISNPGVTAGVTTVNRFYKDWGIQIRLQVGSTTRERTFNVGNIDLGEFMRSFMASFFEVSDSVLITADSLQCTLSYREVFQGHTNAYIVYGTTLNLNRGRLEAGETTPLSGFFGTRPEITYVVNGQRVPIGFYNQGATATLGRDFGSFQLPISVSAQIRQRLLIFDTVQSNGVTYNEVTLAGQRRRMIFDRPALPFIELHWRGRQGVWNSHYFYVTDKRHAVSKDEVYLSNAVEAAQTIGAITAPGKRFFNATPTDVWTLNTGKVSDGAARWLRVILESDEVFYRLNGEYYPIIVLPTSVPFFAESQLAEFTFEIASAYYLQLRDPEPPIPVDPILNAWVLWNDRATTDGALPIENNECMYNTFRSIFQV